MQGSGATLKSPRAHYETLKSKWTQKHRELQKNLWDKHKEYLQPHIDKLQNAPKQIVAGSMAGLMILAQPVPSSLLAYTTDHVQANEQPAQPIVTTAELLSELRTVVPAQVQPLTDDENTKTAGVLSKYYHMTITHNLNNMPLNRTYGIIGAEQHLRRYPGDTMSLHFDNPQDAEKYYSSGMAPGRGAWGYFTNSAGELTPHDVMREKYYIAVQTFLAPGWSNNIRGHYEFYKFRKMLVVNPDNGKAVVVVIGDAGPAQWTGKHLGGSPEVMKYLERVDGSGRGPVLYFFIDDPEDKVALGPIEVQ